MKCLKLFTCMSKDNLAGGKLELVEFWDWICWSRLETDHATVRTGDGEGEVGIRSVVVHSSQVVVGDWNTGSGPHCQPCVVHYPGYSIIDRGDDEPQVGGDAGLVLVRPVQPHRPRHQHQPVLQTVRPIVNILKHRNIWVMMVIFLLSVRSYWQINRECTALMQ